MKVACPSCGAELQRLQQTFGPYVNGLQGCLVCGTWWTFSNHPLDRYTVAHDGQLVHRSTLVDS